MQQPTNDCGILEKQHNLLNIRHLYDIYIYILLIFNVLRESVGFFNVT